jgi:hypothetical protein
VRGALAAIVRSGPSSWEVPTGGPRCAGFEMTRPETFTRPWAADNLARLYTQALRGTPETIDGQPPLPMPEVCPVRLDELLSDDP